MPIRLHRSATIETQCVGVTDPWLRGANRTAWQDARPVVVLTPSRTEGFYLRGRMVAEGQALGGVRFWTPSDLRQFLVRTLPATLQALSRAEQRLLARSCAEELARDRPEEPAVMKGVAADPGSFLRAYDLLLGAGWQPEKEGDVAGRPLAALLARRLKAMKSATQAGLHRHLADVAAKSSQALVARLLIAGFNGAHWPLWDLLRAAVLSSEEIDVALTEPRYFRAPVDESWIGTWEQLAGVEASVVPAGEEEEEALAALAEAYERGATENLSKLDVTFLANAQLGDHALGLVARALDYLARPECTRLGLIFPEANALAAEVGAELRRLGVPLNDGTGIIQPGRFETRPWQTWVDLQESPSVATLIAWVRACAAAGLPLHEEGLSADEIVRLIDTALGETLVDDLGFLRRQLESDGGRPEAVATAAFLGDLVFLPAEGTFGLLLDLTRRALERPGWEAFGGALPSILPSGFESLKSISRRAFLGWLREATDSRTPLRGGNDFYGRVHLVLYAKMTGQTWSHLILTGQNEGVWPRLATGEAFLPRHELAVLNEKARGLNRRATSPEAQALGIEAMRPGFAHCLLPMERQDLSRRDLCAALEATRYAVCVAALTTAGGRNVLPSDFFGFAYLAAQGRTLGQEDFLALDRVAYHRPTERFSADDPFLHSTREAHAARHDASRPFGPWEFAYVAPPPEPIQLPCKRWENAWNDPAGTWLAAVVGTQAWPEGHLNWANATGAWVHRWMREALRELARGHGAPATLGERLEEVIKKDRAALDVRARASGLALYSWWPQVWNQARLIALSLGDSLAPGLADRLIFSEYRLPKSKIALPGCDQADFDLFGRLDLLLAEELPTGAASDFAGRDCWVIDFKTGTGKSISASRFPKERTLQVALYGLAVEALGASGTSMTLLFGGQAAKPQLSVNQVREQVDFFRLLDRMHRDGIFGQRDTSDHGYGGSLPIAVRPVAARVLHAKWELVHGTRPEPGEGET